MREIQATEAKTRLAELLRAVEHGETVAINPTWQAGCSPRSRRRSGPRQPGKGGRAVPAAPRWVKRVAFSTDEILASRHGGHRL